MIVMELGVPDTVGERSAARDTMGSGVKVTMWLTALGTELLEAFTRAPVVYHTTSSWVLCPAMEEYMSSSVFGLTQTA